MTPPPRRDDPAERPVDASKARVRPRILDPQVVRRPRLRPGESRHVAQPGVARSFETLLNPQGRLHLGDVRLAATVFGVEVRRTEVWFLPARLELPLLVEVCGMPTRQRIWFTNALRPIAHELRLRARDRSCAVFVEVRRDGSFVVAARDYWRDRGTR